MAEINGQVAELSYSKPANLVGDEIVKVFPLTKNILPFSFVVGTLCDFIKVIKFPNMQILEIIDPPQVLTGEYFKSKSIKGGTASVVGAPFRFNIDFDGKHFSFKLPNALTNIELGENKNLIFLEANQDTQDYTVFFHKVEQKFYEFCGNVDSNETKITAVINKTTLAGHGELREYQINEKNLELASTETVYLNNMPITVPPFLIHIAFFEAVREKDYNLAKTYLTDDLAEKLTPPHFEKFFGTFDTIKPLREEGISKVALITPISKRYANARVFVLTFSKTKISDIVEE